MKTTITLTELRNMDNPLSMFTKYPYESQWVHQDAFYWLQTELLYKQGKRYQKTGRLDSFTGDAAKEICYK